jgi:low temperature requirement protein LtrA
MAAPEDSAGVLRNSRFPQRVGFVELLFDVVFVFAFTRLSDRLAGDLTWRGFLAALVLLLAIWWVWYRMAWTTNRYDPNRPVIQLMVIVTTLGSLLLAAALPAAFRGRGLVFASVYVALQVVRHAWLVLLAGNRRAQLVSVRILFWATLSAPLWIGGVFLNFNARLVLRSMAVAVDYAGGMLDFPTPGLGRAGLRGQRVAVEHLVERYRQVIIIAFGEAILLSGIQFSPYGFQRDRTAALIVSFTITVLLWQIYFYRAGALLPHAIASSRVPAAVGEFASYTHLAMAAGITLIAVGDRIVITHPTGTSAPAWILVIAGGATLFLAGRALLDYLAFSRVSWSRPAGVAILAAAIPLMLRLPPIGVATVTAAVLAGIAIANIVAWRLYPRPTLSPAPSGKTRG